MGETDIGSKTTMKLRLWIGIGLILSVIALSGTRTRADRAKVDFRSDVLPILKQNCIECHGPSQQMHGFRLDRRRDAMRGGTVRMINPGSSASHSAEVGVRFVTGFLIPRPVYEPNVKNHYRGLSRYREGYANRPATGCRAR